MNWVASLEVNPPGGSLRVESPSAAAPPAHLDDHDCSLALAGSPGLDARGVLDTYRREGREAFARLRGTFALLLLDRDNGVAYAVRDPTGTHPLFYERSGRGVRVSPATEALARAEGRTPRLDLLEAAAFIVRASPGEHETLFERVRRLPPGHLLEIREGSVEVERYWEPRGEAGSEDASSRLQELLLQALDRVVEGRVAVFLSGGLDSALVAAVAAEHARRRGLPPPVGLSIAFRGTDTDEEPTQREVARLLGLELVLRTPDELAGPCGVLQAALRRADTPSDRPPELLDSLYDQLALLGLGRGCRTALNGAGGDEWLLPPPGYAADRVLRLDIAALVDLYRASAGYWPGRQPAGAIRLLWRSGFRAAARAAVVSTGRRVAAERLRETRLSRARARVPTWVVPDPDLRHLLLTRIVDETNQEPPGRAAKAQKRELLQSGEFSVARETMFELRERTGVVASAPLLDSDVVEFLYQLDPRRLIAGGRAKSLARDVLAKHLPRFSGTWPRTVYGNSFWFTTLAAEAPAAWSEAPDAAGRLAELGLVDAGRASALLAGAQPPGPDDLVAAWRALSLGRWLRGVEER